MNLPLTLRKLLTLRLFLSLAGVLLSTAIIRETFFRGISSRDSPHTSEASQLISNNYLTPTSSKTLPNDELDDDDELATSSQGSLLINKPSDDSPSSNLPNGGSAAGTTIYSSEFKDRDESDSEKSKDEDLSPSFNDIIRPLSFEEKALAAGRIFGARVTTAGGGEAATDNNVEATPTPDNNEPSKPWVFGQARGYTMLYAMHPLARPVVESHISALLTSRIREPYIGVLVDGTFQKNYTYLRNIVDRLSQDNRKVTVVLYLSNGPSMRRVGRQLFDFPFANISPIDFRRDISSDPATRETFTGIANEAARFFRYNQNTHPQNSNIAIVMLEDNLDRESYSRMRLLAQRSLGKVATFIRNPCVNCGVGTEGNDDNSLGDPREEHALNRFTTLNPGDAYSLDGVGFAYPDESAPLGAISALQVKQLFRASLERRLQYVGLWRSGWQGIVDGQQPGNPDQRNYQPPTASHRDFEIELLREGLQAEPPE